MIEKLKYDFKKETKIYFAPLAPLAPLAWIAEKLKNWWISIIPSIGLAPVVEDEVKLHLTVTKNGYRLSKSGADKAIKLFKEQDAALEFSQKYAVQHCLTLYIHAADGTVLRKITNDA